ncbi:MAG: hypothetical protein CMH53_03705 [Myxococcales bacterium]|nr:hypothetical protein [Myxococcales bacterium]
MVAAQVTTMSPNVSGAKGRSVLPTVALRVTDVQRVASAVERGDSNCAYVNANAQAMEITATDCYT